MRRFDDSTTLSLLYHLNSEPWLNTEAYEAAVYEIEYKELVPPVDAISLPAPEASPLLKLLESRRSCRQYYLRSMPLTLFSTVLKAAYGIVRMSQLPSGGFNGLFRSVPSAGGLFPLELYAVTQKIEGISDGLHHYNVRDHSLETVKAGQIFTGLHESMLADPLIQNASMVIFITAVFSRTQKKYGPRGYRYILLEAGHAAQNICLVSAELGLGSLCIGGFIDSKLNRFLEFDGVTEAIVYAIAVGYPTEG